MAESLTVENDLRHHSITPLGFKQRVNLRNGFFGIIMGPNYCNKGRVPIPLMWIEGRSRLRCRSKPVLSKDFLGFFNIVGK
jgi:hypothetical protein